MSDLRNASVWLASYIVDRVPAEQGRNREHWLAMRQAVREVLEEVERDGVLGAAISRGYCVECQSTGEVKTCGHLSDTCPCARSPCPSCRT